MDVSLIYRSATTYDGVMRALYGRYYPARTLAIADLIPSGCRVLDLCCGPASLYERHLRAKGVDYLGLDINPRFIARVRRLGGKGEVRDLHDDEALPRADYVVMQASLYHFLPDATVMLDRMEKAAIRRIIVAEPVRNLASSRNLLLAALARRMTDPGVGGQAQRFDEARLDGLMFARANRVIHSFLIPGGREKVYVLDVGRPTASPVGGR